MRYLAPPNSLSWLPAQHLRETRDLDDRIPEWSREDGSENRSEAEGGFEGALQLQGQPPMKCGD